MFKINLNTSDKQLIDSYKLIKNKTKKTDKNGNIKEYVSYNCSFPYSFVDMFNNPKSIYFYQHQKKCYITNFRPTSEYVSKKVNLKNRKSSQTNSDYRKWAKVMTVPKKIMGDVGNYNELTYVLHINQKDFVSGKDALLEVILT